MTVRPEVLRALIAAGATAEMIVAAVEADQQAERAVDEARKAAKRANNAERQRRFKERRRAEQSGTDNESNADNALPHVGNADNAPSPSPEQKDPAPQKTQTPSQPLQKENPPLGGQKKEVPLPENRPLIGDVIPMRPAEKPPPAKRAHRLPPDFTLTPERLAFALKEGHTHETASREFDKFCDYHASRGSTFVDWNRAWQTWVRNSVDRFRGPVRAAAAGGGQQTDGRFGAMQRAIARFGNADDVSE